MTPLGTLYVISSPLGNSADLSARAVATLRSVDVVFAEDTRTARQLMAAHGFDRPTQSCFDANEAGRADEIPDLLRQGKSIGLISEAGTPTVSDPGYRVVRAAIGAGAKVVPIPGASAVLAALVGSGLPTDRFFFVGFPPRKTSARRALFTSLQALPATLIFYESPRRVPETLVDMVAVFGVDRPACVARELTKTHEEFARGSLADLAARYRDDRPLGEVTLVVGGTSGDGAAIDEAELRVRAAALLGSGQSPRDVAQSLVGETGRARREMYQLVLSVAKGESAD